MSINPGRCWKCTMETMESCAHLPRDTRHLGLTPAIANQSWEWNYKAEDACKLPQAPLLSFVVLSFKEGFDINDVSQPAHNLWVATIAYLKTLPDRRSISWGADADDPSKILLLIQWTSSAGWQIFQNSFGVGHMLEMLAKPPLNRCAQMETSNLGARDRVLELVFFIFDSVLDKDTASTFYEHWKNLADVVKKDLEVDCQGQWMERDIPLSPFLMGRIRNSEAYEEADRECPYFVGIFSWNEGSYSADFSNLSNFTSKLTLLTTKGLERIVVRPVSDVEAWYPPSQTPEAAPHSTACLFKKSPNRQYLEDSGANGHKLDRYAHASIQEVSDGKRLYPAPYGEYIQMGLINQYRPVKEMVVPALSVSSSTSVASIPIDICWLELQSRVPGLDTSVAARNVLRTLRTNIRAQEGCTEVKLGRDEEQNEFFAVIVTWDSFSKRASSWHQFQSCFQAVAAETIYFKGLKIHSLASETDLGPHLLSNTHLEVASFYLPAIDRYKTLFEAYYYSYQSTMTPKRTVWNQSTACRQRASGWQSEAVIRNGARTYCFISFIQWTDVFEHGTALAARKEWYGDFAEGMESYDRLGHQIDALQMLAVGGVDSRFVALIKV